MRGHPIELRYVLEATEGPMSGERLEVTIIGYFSPWHLPLEGWRVAEEVTDASKEES